MISWPHKLPGTHIHTGIQLYVLKLTLHSFKVKAEAYFLSGKQSKILNASHFIQYHPANLQTGKQSRTEKEQTALVHLTMLLPTARCI